MNQIDRSEVGGVIFITLTLAWHRVVSGDDAVQESWRLVEVFRRKWEHRLRRYLRKRGADAFWVWKKEPHGENRKSKQAGFPHLHVLLFFRRGSRVPKLGRFRRWNDAAWHDSAERAAENGCRTELMNTWNGVTSYLASYCSAEVIFHGENSTGRIWGIGNRSAMPVDLHVVEHVEPAVLKRMQRSMRKLASRKSEKWWFVDEFTGRRATVAGLEATCDGRFVRVPLDGQRGRTMEAPASLFRRSRRRCGANRLVDVWIEERAYKSRRADLKREEPQKHFFGWSNFFVDPASAIRLLEFFIEQHRRCVEGGDVAPF